MSWSFQLQKINQSFEKIAAWYYDFLQRTEDCFQALHDRVTYLEERQSRLGPSDEQVERVLRKILAERFSNDGLLRTDSLDVAKSNNIFVDNARNRSSIKPIHINGASLFVEPDSVPSRAYAETFHMLEGRLTAYPRIRQEGVLDQDDVPEERIKMEYG
jgi:hypothetical protein